MVSVSLFLFLYRSWARYFWAALGARFVLILGLGIPLNHLPQRMVKSPRSISGMITISLTASGLT